MPRVTDEEIKEHVLKGARDGDGCWCESIEETAKGLGGIGGQRVTEIRRQLVREGVLIQVKQQRYRLASCDFDRMQQEEADRRCRRVLDYLLFEAEVEGGKWLPPNTRIAAALKMDLFVLKNVMRDLVDDGAVVRIGIRSAWPIEEDEDPGLPDPLSFNLWRDPDLDGVEPFQIIGRELPDLSGRPLRLPRGAKLAFGFPEAQA